MHQCSEDRPICLQCKRRALRCAFPASHNPVVKRPPQPSSPESRFLIELHAGKDSHLSFDCRLLDKFRQDAYPHMPLDCANVWRDEIPPMAYHVFLHPTTPWELDR